METESNAAYLTVRLYGTPGAEELHFDPADVYEHVMDERWDVADRTPFTIEEWSVHPPEYHMPPAEAITLWMVEWATEYGEVTEGWDTSWEKAASAPEVVAAAEALRTTCARLVTYYMADQRLAVHTVTWDAQDRPLLDGERLYVPAVNGPSVEADR